MKNDFLIYWHVNHFGSEILLLLLLHVNTKNFGLIDDCHLSTMLVAMYKRSRRRKLAKGIVLKNQREIAQMQDAGKLVADCFALLHESIQPGVRLNDLDRKVEELIIKSGAKPLYKDYRGNPPTHPPFPSVICASVNNVICHGPATDQRLRKGDIIGIDIGLRYNDYCGDACVTFPVGEVSPEVDTLLRVSKEAMDKGIAAAKIGRRLGEIGVAVQKHANAHGYSVVREWGGHGIGRELHEGPSIPHTGPKAQGVRMKPGMVFTIEPMINEGDPDCVMLEEDGWTVVTADGSLSAQFEHTIAITRNGPVILSPWHETMQGFAYI